jgi:hypothetical protein
MRYLGGKFRIAKGLSEYYNQLSTHKTDSKPVRKEKLFEFVE